MLYHFVNVANFDICQKKHYNSIWFEAVGRGDVFVFTVFFYNFYYAFINTRIYVDMMRVFGTADDNSCVCSVVQNYRFH